LAVRHHWVHVANRTFSQAVQACQRHGSPFKLAVASRIRMGPHQSADRLCTGIQSRSGEPYFPSHAVCSTLME
jgi:hypothetical protein